MHLPDCLLLNNAISISSSVSCGGCKDADRSVGPFGNVTSSKDGVEPGVDTADLILPSLDLSVKFIVLDKSIFSTVSISDAPFPAASGMLFNRLIDEEECRCLVVLYPFELDGIANLECSILVGLCVPNAVCGEATLVISSSDTDMFGEL